jgi:hypothetical protein
MSEIPEFWSSFEPEEVVPRWVRKFLHRDENLAAWGQTTGYYAHAYARGFERLVMEAISIWPRSEYLRLPLFFLARHAAELHLKQVIQEYAVTAAGPSDATGHSLIALWNRASNLVQAPPDDEWSAHVGRLIKHLHDFDPDGQRFRYPGDIVGKPFDGTRVELERLAHAHGGITLWCEGACDMLDVSRE